MELDRNSLKSACYDYAKLVYWERKPTDVKEIQDFADSIYNRALSFTIYMEEQGRDPNFLTGCVRYLEIAHAMPPLKGDSNFVWEALTILVELACPNSIFTTDQKLFFKELAVGINEAAFDAKAT